MVTLAFLSDPTAAQVVAMPEREAPAGRADPPQPIATLIELPVHGAVVMATPQPVEALRAGDGSPGSFTAFGRTPEPGTATFVVPAGQRQARIRVTSPSAVSLRVGLVLDSNASYRIAAWSAKDVTATTVSVARWRDGHELAWTPLTNGETQDLVVTNESHPVSSWTLTIARISHFDTPVLLPGSSVGPKSLGDSAACQLDFACLQPFVSSVDWNTLLGASRAVVLMVMTFPDGSSGTCTGTLLNSASYPAPLILTANHCVDGLGGLTTLWFYSRTTCGSGTPTGYTQLVSPGRTLWRSASLDGALLMLDVAPPSQSRYAGWDASVVSPGSVVLAVHHPKGDVKKASFATVVGENTATTTISGVPYPPGTFYVTDWEVGIVEPGSSGSGIFTYSASLNSMMLRATLTGGSATCSATKARTLYSELANVYPQIKSTITTAPLGERATAVEYYHAAFDHYFVTALADEIAKLDNGTFVGWSRTGRTFNVYAASPSGTAPVCRFFSVSFAPKSSHFYTPDPGECAKVKTNGNWQFEAVVFSMPIPDALGVCPAATIPVYRLYNNGQGAAPNHRYTVSTAVRAQMVARGWIPEGYGASGVIMCAPL